MKLQLWARHLSESVRHFLTLLLVAGTAGATLSTMSGGRIHLERNLELLLTTGGVALAAELAVIFIGLHLGRLDNLIRAARRPEDREAYRRDRGELTRWFYVIVGISAVSNCIYRIQQLWPARPTAWSITGNVLLAVFVALVPIPLIILFTIKVRPLPPDYAEQGRQAYQQGLILMQRGASYIMQRGMKRMLTGTATEADRAAMAFATGVLGIHARPDERAQLDYAINQHAALLGDPNGPATVDGEVIEFITTRDIMDQWNVPERTAQEWARTCPGRKRVPGSRAWEVPRSAIVSAHGSPIGASSPVPARNRRRNRTATEPQVAAAEPQMSENRALAYAYTPLIEGVEPPTNL